MLGLKLTVVPEGIPEADRLTALLNPLLRVLVIVATPWLPGATLRPEGEAERVKVGAPLVKVVALDNAAVWAQVPGRVGRPHAILVGRIRS